MRREKSRCVTVKYIMLVIAKFDPAFALARRFSAMNLGDARFEAQSSHCPHRGTKGRKDLQEVADVYASAINVAVKVDGILSKLSPYIEKYFSMCNMDQTGVCIDSPGRSTKVCQGDD
ncbi:hypothetical protein PHPALM_31968 [Phytophthora palmivora]|uniref:Uncharacterized protein n=1 Tax=Phytophthora palmivora TaxID=4796 RepID=A0A2P4X185_9STRA|nr:hypothetical protein PHPALM_31968 [Phytophthora palmivora]